MLKDFVFNYLKTFAKYIKMYKSEKIKDKFDESEHMYLEFIKFSHDITKKIRKELNESDYFPISQIIKNIESTIECIKSIFMSIAFNQS